MSELAILIDVRDLRFLGLRVCLYVLFLQFSLRFLILFEAQDLSQIRFGFMIAAGTSGELLAVFVLLELNAAELSAASYLTALLPLLDCILRALLFYVLLQLLRRQIFGQPMRFLPFR